MVATCISQDPPTPILPVDPTDPQGRRGREGVKLKGAEVKTGVILPRFPQIVTKSW